MSNVTKEWLLKTIAELEEERDATHGAVNEDAALALAAMKIALASLEARSRKLFTCSACGAEGLDEPLESKCHCNEDGAHWIESVVYTAPPALMLPEEMPKGLAGQIVSLLAHNIGDKFLAQKIWNACRAAMLQGAEPVTTAYKLPFKQWLSQQTGTIDVECGCVMTEVFFHWLRVAYEAGNSPVIPDGWVMVPEEPTHEMLEAGDEQFGTYDVYRRMIAASPQQK